MIAFNMVYKLYITDKQYPIMHAFKTHNSSSAWLTTIILDYYVETLAFSTVVYSVENYKYVAIVWIILNCTLGSPIAILYLLTHQQLLFNLQKN